MAFLLLTIFGCDQEPTNQDVDTTQGNVSVVKQQNSKQTAEEQAIEHLKSKGASFIRRNANRGHDKAEPFLTVILHNKPLVVSDVEYLKQIKDLRGLGISSTAISDEILGVVAELKTLSILHCSNLSGVSDRGVDKLSNMVSLEELSLCRLDVSDEAFKRFHRLRSLKILVMRELSISDECLESIKELPNLEVLDLYMTRVTDAGCETLAKMPALRYVALHDTGIGNMGVKFLSRSQSLHGLALSNTQIDDRALSFIPNFGKIDSLSLNRTNVTDEGLKHLQKTNLKHITLPHNLGITDLSLCYLQEIKTLEQLNIQTHGTKISEEGLRELQNARPKLEIVVNIAK
jgi:hypothetical protein